MADMLFGSGRFASELDDIAAKRGASHQVRLTMNNTFRNICRQDGKEAPTSPQDVPENYVDKISTSLCTHE